MKKRKVLFCSSAGGHYSELMQLKEIIKKYQGVVITEKTAISENTNLPTEYVPYSSKNEGIKYILKFLYVCFLSIIYFIKYRPKVIVSTGVHSTVPLCVLGRLCRCKVIYIETVAVLRTPTLTGRIMYWVATDFYIQWEELKEVYPKAKFGGILF